MNGALVMEGVLRTLFSHWSRTQEHDNIRHLQTDQRSVAVDIAVSAARPYTSLKARMLGGQAETIMRLRGLLR
jgi:hypothetical protein